MNNPEESLEVQRAVEDFYSWTKSLDLELSIEKCVVMHCGRKNENRDYFINGKQLKCAPNAEDLGVVMSPNFNFREQTREVVSRTARQMNFILRCFVLSDGCIYEAISHICHPASHILRSCMEPLFRKRQGTDSIGVRQL